MDIMSYISTATRRNWNKLGYDENKRLRSRANKTCSVKKVIPENYLNSIGELDSLVEELSTSGYRVEDIVYSLCCMKLEKLRKKTSCNVAKFYEEYGGAGYVRIQIGVSDLILVECKGDWIGYIYQSLLPEGYRNLNGVYYTGKDIVHKMMDGLVLDESKTIFDPCCGSGAFLMACDVASLSQIYGVDIDPVAVMIAKTNLISKFSGDKEYPNIVCCDYLLSDAEFRQVKFDYIYTNPPWGTSKVSEYYSDTIYSKERASLFFVKAFSQLSDDGYMCFLLPTSLLKIKIHSDIRFFILSETKIRDMHIYKEKFNGVYTDFFSISVGKSQIGCPQSYSVYQGDDIIHAMTANIDDFCSINMNTEYDDQIMNILENRRYDNLSHSKWALGIVTGDNKGKLKKEQEIGTEPVFTGRDISKYKLSQPSNFVHYDRSVFQQCAKDEIYRCGEKLVYKFISRQLCFAYDNTGSLFLNSANILIPDIEGMSVKTVMAFLNSELFSFYYKKKFMDIKILRGNLETLPFPKIALEQDNEISIMVDEVIENVKDRNSDINDYIYNLYGISNEMVKYIKIFLYGAFAE